MIDLNFLKKKKTFKKHSIGPDPNLSWMIIFCTAVVLILTSFVFGFYVFMKIDKEEALAPSYTNRQLGKISPERINKVLKVFSDRENKSKEIIDSQAIFVDPSL